MNLQFQIPPPHIHTWKHEWRAGRGNPYHQTGHIHRLRLRDHTDRAQAKHEIDSYADYNHGDLWTYLGVRCHDCGDQWS